MGTVAFKDMDFEKPTAIITVGPYAFSRNPMYVARTLIYLAFALLVNTWCLIILLPVLLFFMHYHVVVREERQLEEKFDDEYLQYRARMRRCL